MSAAVDTLAAEQEEKEDSMEELKMLEDEEENGTKCGNAEEFFGTERLIMSSDSEHESPQKIKANKLENNEKKDDLMNDLGSLRDEVESATTGDNEHKKSKKRMIIDSDDEESEVSKKSTVDSIESEVKQIEIQLKKKYSNLIDSESESETVESKLKSSIDNKVENSTTVEQKLNKKFSSLIDSESETEESKDKDEQNEEDSTSAKDKYVDEITKIQQKLKKKYSNLIDSESEPETSDNEVNNVVNDEKLNSSETETHQHDVKTVKEKKPMRASAKKAIDEMQAIQSEQQRLHREASISVPYHVPKRYTLQEFLKRRTIIKPHLKEEGNPIAAVVKTKSLKMTPEELAEYAKLMDERVKEATEFFKSESESEDDEVEKNGNVEANTETTTEKQVNEENVINDASDTPQLLSTDVLNENTDAQELDEEMLPSTSKPIITEVLELPNFDFSTVHLTTNENTSKTQKQSTKSENIKRLIGEQKLPDSPSLRGDPNMLIDLETGDLVQKTPTGVDNLLQRLLSTKGRKHKNTETVSILSTENGKLEMSTVNVHVTEETDPNIEHKPGAAYFKLKENLKSIIKEKRLKEMQKKQKDEKEHLKCLADEDDDDEEEDELEEFDLDNKPSKKTDVDDLDEMESNYNADEDENDIDDMDDDELDPEVKDEETKKNEKNYNYVCDGNNDDEDNNDDKADGDDNDDEDDNDDDDEDDDEGKCDTDDGAVSETEQIDIKDENTIRKSRIITAFENDSDDDIDFLKTQVENQTKEASLFVPDTQKSPTENEQELLALCSGKFDETQKSLNDSAMISQIPITQQNSEQGHTDELLELCSGTFETQNIDVSTQPDSACTPNTTAVNILPKSNKILSSDEENDMNVNVVEKQKKLTKRMKKRAPKLDISDDEDEHDNEKSASENEDELEEVVEEEPETFIDYDSEENEIVVQMTKKDCAKEANKFLEHEAELSESDWGSADEDEKNMDKYDIELGDEDEFDREKLQTELGKIHARKVLDEDIREVRRFQEMFIADEEEDGVQRQRQFRWKNTESGFSLDDENRKENDNEANDSGDEESEHLWRKIRFEREQVLLEQGQKEDITSNVSSVTITTTPGTNKKLNIITARKITTAMNVKNDASFLITKTLSPTTISIASVEKKIRGSFLVRDRETLAKLASMTKGTAALSSVGGVAASNDDTAGTVSVKTVKAKNFVFATLTEEEHESLKRKADDLLNSSSEGGINYMKKPRIEPRRSKCLIDQLL